MQTPPTQKSEKILFAAVTLGALVMSLVYYFRDPATTTGFHACLFHAWTGLHCAGCGGQRAAHALLRGHIAQAASLNLLAVFTAPAAAYAYVGWALRIFTAMRLPMPQLSGRRMLWIMATAAAFMFLRNLPWHMFSWLAP